MKTGLQRKLKRVRLFLCDVDGVLTDGTVWMGGGVETKGFHVTDGLGLRWLQRCGIRVGWISRRPSGATTQRADDLKIDYLRQVDGCKVQAIEGLLSEAGMGWEQVCYVGDDVVDLGALARAGVAVAVANGVREIKRVADYVTRLPGGQGAVREVIELILKAQGYWPGILKEHRE
jgi:3-deoxy-D-manno-octulosonate 8-phosphate phosphatase (KDO 8-P phosphatase)